MATSIKLCTSDDDFSKASIFMIDHQKDIHPSYTTLDMVSLVYSYITQGYIISVTNTANEIIGLVSYFHGTVEKEFKDKEIAYIDLALLSRDYRGSYVFYKGLLYLVTYILNQLPEVKELRLEALKENTNLCKLYSKFTSPLYEKDSERGKIIVFSEEIKKVETILFKKNRKGGVRNDTTNWK